MLRDMFVKYQLFSII
nr:unnamed protein product [Callosobruchus analis]